MDANESPPRLKPLRIIFSTIVIIALAAGGYLWLNGLPGGTDVAAAEAPNGGAADAEAQSIQAPRSVPVPVVTAPARRGQLVMKITATGNAEAPRQVDLLAASPGDLAAVNVSEGQVVQAGDVLAAIDDTELKLKVRKAREALVTAAANFSENVTYLRDFGGDDAAALQSGAFSSIINAEDFRSLIDDPRFDELFSTITRDEVMAARDNLLAQQANFEQAELELARARTIAPFGGQVASLDVVVGQRVGANTKLVTLVDSNPIRVRVGVLESEAGLVRVGRRAEVHFAAYPGETFVGQIEAISPIVDPEERTLEVLVMLPNEDLRLKPGMFAQITLETQIFEDRIVVPSSAVLLRGDRPMVFRVVDGRSDWVYIEKGLENADWVEVLDGIAPGDEVIVSGHYSLAHDAAVRVVEAEADAEPR